MVKQEWKKLFHNKILLMVTIAVIAIPSIYTALFLGSMWDPYGSTDHLPVAVVNQDRPAVMNGKEVALGSRLSDRLKEDNSMKFRLTDQKTAEQWLKDGKCYMVITIPEDFSAHAATLTQAEPQKMLLSYETNPGTNYIASKMSETAMKSVESSVRQEVTRQYAQALLESIKEAGAGMQEAAGGSGQLVSGLGQAADGNALVTDSLDVLSESCLTFQSGSSTLSEGLKAYTEAVHTAGDGMQTLDRGAGQLEQGALKLEAGSGELTGGASSLNDALQKINGADGSQSRALADGAEKISQGMAALAGMAGQIPGQEKLASCAGMLESADTALTDVAAGADPSGLEQQIQAAEASGDVQALSGLAMEAVQAASSNYQELQKASAGMAAARTALSETKQTLDQASGALAGTQQLAGQLQTLAGSSEQLAENIGSYTEGVAQAAEGSSSLAAGMQTFSSAVTETREGIQSLKTGADRLAAGTAQADGASSALLSGAERLTAGAAQIAGGAGQISSGSRDLGKGLAQMKEGSGKLETELQGGASQIQNTSTSDQTADMFAAPVELKETKATDVPDNGHAMAPYMMSVGLWVGCIAFSLMYPLNRLSGRLKSAKAWWLSKASVLYTVALLQALLMLGILHVCCGFSPAEWGATILTACLASVAFMSVMYFFTSVFGKIGSFLMLVFMVIQLAGSAGTYPLEISGSFVPALHGWVPFTYTVKAFRSTISGGESIAGCLLFLAVLLAVFSLLSIAAFRIRTARIRAGRPLLWDWLESHGLA